MSEMRRLLDRLEFALECEEKALACAAGRWRKPHEEAIEMLLTDIRTAKRLLAEEHARPDEETLVLA